jgi:hypothetical protein
VDIDLHDVKRQIAEFSDLALSFSRMLISVLIRLASHMTRQAIMLFPVCNAFCFCFFIFS